MASKLISLDITDPRPPFLVPVILGLGVSAISSVLLLGKLVWIALFLGGLAVAILAFVATDARNYWLVVFLMALPLNIKKLLFVTPETIANIKETYHLYVIENVVPPLYIFDLPLLVLIGIWLWRHARLRERNRTPKAFYWMVAFMLWSACTIAISRAPILGGSWLYIHAKALLIFLCFVSLCRTKRSLRVVVAALLIGLAMQVGLTLYSYYAQTGESTIFGGLLGGVFGQEKTQKESKQEGKWGSGSAYVYEEGKTLRGTGTLGAANNQAKYYNLLLPLALVSGLFARRDAARLAYLTIFLAGLAALILTFSRGGIVVIFVGLGSLLILMVRGHLLKKRTFLVLVCAGLVVLGAVSPLLYKYFTTRPGYAHTRLDHARAGFKYMLQKPIMGVGINNFQVAIGPLDTEIVFGNQPIHNHYLRIGIETGFVGLALYIPFFLWVVAQGYRCIQSKDRFLSSTAMGLLASIIAIMVYWADDLFYDATITVFTWINIGMILVIKRLIEEAPKNSSRISTLAEGTS
jgi:hypothetical protein